MWGLRFRINGRFHPSHALEIRPDGFSRHLDRPKNGCSRWVGLMIFRFSLLDGQIGRRSLVLEPLVNRGRGVRGKARSNWSDLPPRLSRVIRPDSPSWPITSRTPAGSLSSRTRLGLASQDVFGLAAARVQTTGIWIYRIDQAGVLMGYINDKWGTCQAAIVVMTRLLWERIFHPPLPRF